MPVASSPHPEALRLAALQRLGILDTGPEDRFDRITRLAQHVFRVPIVLVSFVDADRQWFKSCIGLEVAQTSRDSSFCSFAIQTPDAPLIVLDAREDMRFAQNPLVSGPPFIRFYAGQPIRSPDGPPVGTLCVIDTQPHPVVSAEELQALADLGALVERELTQAALRDALAAQRAAEAEYARFVALVDTLPDFVAMVDLEARPIYLNPAARAMLGEASDTPLDQVSMKQAHPAHMHPLLLEQALPAAETTGKWVGETALLRADGTEIPVEQVLLCHRDAAGTPLYFSTIARDLTPQRQAAAAERAFQAEIIRLHEASIAELSTPLIRLSERTVLMPLIGAIDHDRAQRILTTLLDGVAAQRAQWAILDLTGVPVVDRHVAQALLQAARAAQLLGSAVILTGIRPETAQTLVALGADLDRVLTYSNLQQGIAAALASVLPAARNGVGSPRARLSDPQPH